MDEDTCCYVEYDEQRLPVTVRCEKHQIQEEEELKKFYEG